jgi:hypothetical protein
MLPNPSDQVQPVALNSCGYSKQPIPLTADPTLVDAPGHTQDAVGPLEPPEDAHLQSIRIRARSRTIAQVIAGVRVMP